MRDLIVKLSRYVVTGGIAAVVDAGCFVLLIGANFDIVPASVLSFSAAAFVNYRLTSRFVFSHDATIRGFALFLLAALVGLTVNVGVTLLGALFFGLPPIVAKLFGIGTAFLVNFTLNLVIVFRGKA